MKNDTKGMIIVVGATVAIMTVVTAAAIVLDHFLPQQTNQFPVPMMEVEIVHIHDPIDSNHAYSYTVFEDTTTRERAKKQGVSGSLGDKYNMTQSTWNKCKKQ